MEDAKRALAVVPWQQLKRVLDGFSSRNSPQNVTEPGRVMTKPLTVFKGGYWGWGNSTAQLQKLTAAIERRRGFRPPVFVDIRVRRSVRAVGFNGAAFEGVVGRNRYRWMQDLGNQSIVDGGSRIRIRRPAAAEELLDLAVEAARRGQRIIYFCSCDLPCDCHRTTVARLLIAAARRRKRAVEVIEWPGGEPSENTYQLTVAPETLRKFRKSLSGLKLPANADLRELVALPVGTIVCASASGEPPVAFAAAPAMPSDGGWCLPVLWDDSSPTKANVRATAAWRKSHGYATHRSRG